MCIKGFFILDALLKYNMLRKPFLIYRKSFLENSYYKMKLFLELNSKRTLQLLCWWKDISEILNWILRLHWKRCFYANLKLKYNIMQNLRFFFNNLAFWNPKISLTLNKNIRKMIWSSILQLIYWLNSNIICSYF